MRINEDLEVAVDNLEAVDRSCLISFHDWLVDSQKPAGNVSLDQFVVPTRTSFENVIGIIMHESLKYNFVQKVDQVKGVYFSLNKLRKEQLSDLFDGVPDSFDNPDTFTKLIGNTLSLDINLVSRIGGLAFLYADNLKYKLTLFL
jgi:hypothetical protein